MPLLILWDIWVTNDHDYVPYVVIIIWPSPYWWLISGFVTRAIRRVPQVRSELLILPEDMSSSPDFARSVDLYILFAHHCVSFCPLSFVHCIISSSSVDGLWLPRWYLQAFLPMSYVVVFVVVIVRFVKIVDHHV
jgi:hypothetical protein